MAGTVPNHERQEGMPAVVRYRCALVGWWALVTLLIPFASASATTPLILQVRVSQGFPGLNRSALSRFIAAHMAEARLADWRFEPARGSHVAADRVEWTIKLNPYAGGEVRSFVHWPSQPYWLGGRLVTIEARLYLGGEYQTLVEEQATIRGGPNHLILASTVVSVTQNLLGPTGAYRAIDMGQHRSQ
jgi:hypothetical protein